MMMNYKVICNLKRFYSSALYITGDKAQKTYVVLNPVIDFEKHLTKPDKLLKNIEARGLPINVDAIVKKWIFFQDILNRKQTLDQTRQDIFQNISQLLKKQEVDQTEVDKWRLHAKIVKDDLKHLKDSYYDIEGSTMLQILGLPNDLHNKTPFVKKNVICTHSIKPTNSSLNNIDIGIRNGYLKYLDPFTCYLKSDAALLELSILEYFKRKLIKLGYSLFSNPNFCRTIIVEGEEICSGRDKVLTLDEQDRDDDNLNRLHLCGSGTLKSFMVYFARHIVNQVVLPLKYFSLGRIYQPTRTDCDSSLFNLSQQSVVNIFRADLEENREDLDGFIELISKIYGILGVHYRIVILPANRIEKAESLRISIEMYSNFKKEYIEVGNISFYDNYISKRLLFTYSCNKERKYPKIIAGQILNFHKFLGCVMENITSDSENLLHVFLKEKINRLNSVV
ncbi:serine--tRNA synthetase-like protein Slimp [Diorhabda sublineata]|uniref:serine--tRNA synthetase-like protein Slimp n=1 Tax=Diorhabda sublineata TaxID=1163346 RepID=UPI0024E0DE7E|nr:serine--tRNA synthetase-like protein Slimp [Diorhabda sublineata]